MTYLLQTGLITNGTTLVLDKVVEIISDLLSRMPSSAIGTSTARSSRHAGLTCGQQMALGLRKLQLMVVCLDVTQMMAPMTTSSGTQNVVTPATTRHCAVMGMVGESDVREEMKSRQWVEVITCA